MKRLLIGTALSAILTSSAPADGIPPQIVADLQHNVIALTVMLATIDTCQPWFDVSRVQSDVQILVRSGTLNGVNFYRKELEPFIDEVIAQVSAARTLNPEGFCRAMKSALGNPASPPEK